MDLVIYFLCFIILWKSSDLIVGSISKLAHHLRISAFSVSFFILGMLTDLPEATVGVNSLISHTPQIFIGNMLGGILALYIFIVPILAIIGNGISLKHELKPKELILTIFAILMPAILFITGKIYFWQGFILIGLYFLLFFFLEKSQVVKATRTGKFHLGKDLLKICLGVILILFSSHFLVQKTVEFAQVLGVTPFVVSFILMGIGTNIPELSLALDSIIKHKKEIAFGDVLGSAVSYLLIMGVLIIFNWSEISLPANYLFQLGFIIIGLGLFYIFAKSNNKISRREGLVLLAVYVIFLVAQIWNK